MEAFRNRDLGDFINALELMSADVNQKDDSKLSIFHKILSTPHSADYIKICISNGADCYAVNISFVLIFLKFDFIIFFRKLPTIVFPCISRLTRSIPKT